MDYETLFSSINTKLDEERSENRKFRETIQNEIKEASRGGIPSTMCLSVCSQRNTRFHNRGKKRKQSHLTPK